MINIKTVSLLDNPTVHVSNDELLICFQGSRSLYTNFPNSRCGDKYSNVYTCIITGATKMINNGGGRGIDQHERV